MKKLCSGDDCFKNVDSEDFITRLVGKEKYFVHKGTWKNNYEWRIQKVTITGMKIDQEKKLYVEFSFDSCGYEYPINYLQETFEQAQKFAVEEINKEKKKQILSIKKHVKV